MKQPIALLMLALTLALTACGHVDMAINDQPRIYRDAPIQRTPLHISVQPQERTYAPVKALLYPPWVSQPNRDAKTVSKSLGRVLAQTWNGQQVFPVLVYDEDLVYRTPEKAVAAARARGADVVITSVVPYFYDGGGLDSSGASIRLEIRETKTGQVIFAMEQAASIEAHIVNDWVLWSQRTRLPASPMQAMFATMAQDMAVPLSSWLPAPDAVFAETQADVVRGLTERPQQPAPVSAKDKETELAAEPVTAQAMQQALTSPASQAPSVNLMIHFDTDKATIRPESFPLLDELGKALSAPPLKGRRIVIAGHCDSTAGDAYNMRLGKDRAESTKAYLVRKFGIPANLLLTETYGKRRPIAPNDTPEGKQRNRRVEVRLAG